MHIHVFALFSSAFGLTVSLYVCTALQVSVLSLWPLLHGLVGLVLSPRLLLLSCSVIIYYFFIIITLHVIWLPLLVTGMHWDVYCLILFYYLVHYFCGYLPHVLLFIFVHILCITEWARGWYHCCIHAATL